MRAGFFQFEPLFGNKKQNVETVMNGIRDIDIDLLVLPELFSTGYQFTSKEEVEELSEGIPDGYTTGMLLEVARSKDLHIVAGIAERKGDSFYNSAVILGPGGFTGIYRKTHLYFKEKLWFTPGDSGFQVFQTPIGAIGIMICFDWFFPESMRTLALMGAEIVAHPANLVLPYCPSAMPIRCLENRVYAITANRIGTEERIKGEPLLFIGTSQITSPDGTVLARATEKERALIVEDIEPARSRDKSINTFNNIFLDRRPEMYWNEEKAR